VTDLRNLVTSWRTDRDLSASKAFGSMPPHAVLARDNTSARTEISNGEGEKKKHSVYLSFLK
jgi:hypothetical protein